MRNIHHVARRDCLPAKDQRERDSRNQIAVGIHDAAAGPMPLSPIACIEKQAVAGRRATAMLPMLIEPGQRFVARENQRSKRATRKPQHRTGDAVKGQGGSSLPRECLFARGVLAQARWPHFHAQGRHDRTHPMQMRRSLRCRARCADRLRHVRSRQRFGAHLFPRRSLNGHETPSPNKQRNTPGTRIATCAFEGALSTTLMRDGRGARSSRRGILSDPCVRVRVRRGIRLQVQRHGGHRSACF